MTKLKKGYVHIYTGNGKGKTTAALGLALRAAGAGLKTYIAQFMKVYPYSELNSLKLLSDYIIIEQFCGDEFVYKRQLPDENEIKKAVNGLNKAKTMMKSDEYDLIILDEVLVSIYFKLLTVEQLIEIINEKPVNVELILTGRYCPEILYEKADLITEMKEIKHYYSKGITSRKGIES
ncbi:MAG: cob(I)yrinic acid a,c-diamide adenosyltransferase [Ignavibacterium album]|uniref:cob(I)yrinic acid a,c-diamide adenosyltransferase n=1 Tax=Ignavibacterium album TaxID=591197 RepID=UPI0026F35759|nr:cob(I)yrinic acid a,c-diamide adenosyltransferase [Ignavibacterium album]MCX8105790.1 cob(I)yrinic acid a,c-diamide adenosyltransferase [Ignavibacterium album]